MISNFVKYRMNSINIGIELLRSILCLWVVTIHCSRVKNEHKIYLGRGFHVPTFILISFYFYYPMIEKRIIIKIITRFQRLLFPYILWPIIKFIINNFFMTTFSSNRFKTKLSLYDIYLQLLTGARYHMIFWFQFNLIFLSIFSTIIAFQFKEKFLVVMKFIGILSLYLHYSGINVKMFSSFKKPFQMTLGSLQELMPLSIIGYIFGSLNLLFIAKNIPKHIQFILFFLIYFLFRYNIFILHPGFMYPNIILNILSSTILFISFGSLNLNGLSGINSLLTYITKYTGGIYYIHPIFRIYLQKYIMHNLYSNYLL